MKQMSLVQIFLPPPLRANYFKHLKTKKQKKNQQQQQQQLWNSELHVYPPYATSCYNNAGITFINV
jgi:hypothetical protein